MSCQSCNHSKDNNEIAYGARFGGGGGHRSPGGGGRRWNGHGGRRWNGYGGRRWNWWNPYASWWNYGGTYPYDYYGADYYYYYPPYNYRDFLPTYVPNAIETSSCPPGYVQVINQNQTTYPYLNTSCMKASPIASSEIDYETAFASSSDSSFNLNNPHCNTLLMEVNERAGSAGTANHYWSPIAFRDIPKSCEPKPYLIQTRK
jgi:hypothetical protein